MKSNKKKVKFDCEYESKHKSNYEAFMNDQNEAPADEKEDPCLDQSTKKRHLRYSEEEDEEPEGFVGSQVPVINAIKIFDRPLLSTYFLNMENKSSFPRALKMTNKSENREFYFEWSNENAKHFSITPKQKNIRPNEELELSIDFCPESRNRLYSGELDVRIFLLRGEDTASDPEAISLPLTMPLYVIGHSFPADSDGWLEQCEIEPKEVEFPSCTPGEVLYTSIMLKRNGHLPVSYEFIPPKRTSIKIKPPLGHITKSHQIAIVQFNSSNKPDGIHREEWKVAYNTSKKYYGNVIITARVENPAIIVDYDNKYRINPSLPGAVCKSPLTMRNPTRMELKYEFVIPRQITWFEIPVREGIIEPTCEISVDAFFKPEYTGEYLDHISCRVRSVKMPNYVCSTKIQLEGSCHDGTLVATPSFHDFGVCLYGEKQIKMFHLYNFTPVAINFKLFAQHEEMFEKEQNSVHISPTTGFIREKNSTQIEIKLVPRILDVSYVSIMCQLMASEDSECPLPNEPKRIILLKADCNLPKCQIIDLNVESSGPVITPDWMWKMMNINSVNRALNRVLPHEEEDVLVRLPQAPVGSPPIIIHLLFETKNPYPMSFEVRKIYRNHICNVPSWVGLPQLEASNRIIFDPPRVLLKPVQRRAVRLVITFEAVGYTNYEWSLDISQLRLLNLKTTVNAMAVDETMETAMYLEPRIMLEPVYIGDQSPSVHLFWLYNNTPSSSCYMVDKKQLAKSTSPFPKIFDCLNSHGILPPFSCHPVIFSFKPIEAKEYEVVTNICLNRESVMDLKLTGRGILDYSPFRELCHLPSIPEIPILKPADIEVQPSVRVLTVNFVPTFSEVQRVFFLKNLSEDQTWAFRWHVFHIKNVLKARVEPKEGKINPGDKTYQILTIKTYRFPLKTAFSVPCDVTDYTALNKYEAFIVFQKKVSTECQENFTITEEGVSTHEIPNVEMPEKPKINHTFIAVNLHITLGNAYDIKLQPKWEMKQTCGEEIPLSFGPGRELDVDGWRIVNSTLEKIVWNIIYSPMFENRFKKYQEEFGQPTYPEIIPRRERDLQMWRISSQNSLQKFDIQSVLEELIISILSKHSQQ
ncbi:UNVERIFIED_CONTAM: hypothetical protein PYX00_005362 [Menopon gallinae]